MAERRAAVVRLVDGVAGALEKLAQERTDVFVVVDDEDPGRAFIRPSYHPGSPIPAAVTDSWAVARVLICEPHDDISALLELVVRRLGHEPVAFDGR